MRLILRVAEIALLAVAGLYVGDYLSAHYHIPGNRQTWGSVQVKTLWAVRMKNGRSDYSLGDTVTQTCVRSLFPQMGYTPCWYLSRHTTKVITVSRAGGYRSGQWASGKWSTSITWSELEPKLVRKSVWPSAERAISRGKAPAVMAPRTASVPASIFAASRTTRLCAAVEAPKRLELRPNSWLHE